MMEFGRKYYGLVRFLNKEFYMVHGLEVIKAMNHEASAPDKLQAEIVAAEARRLYEDLPTFRWGSATTFVNAGGRLIRITMSIVDDADGIIRDMGGRRVTVGSKVRVHQEDRIRTAVVHKLQLNQPTKNAPGYWVDIDSGEGLEGMPSYLLEVIDD
jgi:hypothetical protein